MKDRKLKKFIISTFQQTFSFMRNYLSNYYDFSRALTKEIREKERKNIQYEFDITLDDMIKKKIKSFGIRGRIFSEESGFYDIGEAKYRVVYDPFCNSSLASKTFHEAAAGISVFNYNYELITSAVMDYQTGLVGMYYGGKTEFFQVQTLDKLSFKQNSNETLEDSWIVITLENQEERKYLEKAKPILDKAKRILISSGHIYWLKLAMGMIDGYLDPFGGEALYEMFACTIAQGNGCIVTDREGESFDPSNYLKIFEKDKNFIFYPVAATNKKLHNELISNIKS